jgi:sugar lactone lactonase YvrE
MNEYMTIPADVRRMPLGKAMAAVDLVLDASHAVGASPLWCAKQQALYWVDIPSRQVHGWTLADQSQSSWQSTEALRCVAPTTSGSWIVGAQAHVLELTPQADGQLQANHLATTQLDAAGSAFNHGLCDQQGRFLLSTLPSDMTYGTHAGAVYSYQLDSDEAGGGQGQLKKLLNGLHTPSGMAQSPDGRTLYVADSHPAVKMVWAYDYNPETGTASHRRVFVDMHLIGGRPEGAAVDAEGCYWVCASDTGRIHRFTPDGELDRTYALPVKQPGNCFFGGPRLDTLFVTSLRPDGIDLGDQPHAGGLFALQPGVCGLPAPTFAPLSTQ